MQGSGDWLPSNHEALYDKAKQTKEYLIEGNNRTRLGFAPDSPQGQWLDTVFLPAFLAFILAFEAWRNVGTRTQIISTTLYDTQKMFAGVYRLLYAGFLKKNPIVTDVDLVAMGLPERGRKRRTPMHPPTTVPTAGVHLPSPGVVEIHFRDSGAGGKAKPAGIHGAEIVWAILETIPVDWTELIHSSFDTNTPLTLTFDGDKRGKHLYFALRWENTRGEKGHWSAIQSVVIP